MEIIKRSQLNEALKTQNYRMICEEVRQKRTAPLDMTYDIFLCHSTDDHEEIRALKAFYENQGKRAYVAEIDDPGISSNGINKHTARTLQNRMMHSEELYYILSKNSQDSTWMPWEVGFFDGKKSGIKIKVVPIVDEHDYEILDFPGHEYLELYSKDGTTIQSLRLNRAIDIARS